MSTLTHGVFCKLWCSGQGCKHTMWGSSRRGRGGLLAGRKKGFQSHQGSQGSYVCEVINRNEYVMKNMNSGQAGPRAAVPAMTWSPSNVKFQKSKSHLAASESVTVANVRNVLFRLAWGFKPPQCIWDKPPGAPWPRHPPSNTPSLSHAPPPKPHPTRHTHHPPVFTHFPPDHPQPLTPQKPCVRISTSALCCGMNSALYS